MEYMKVAVVTDDHPYGEAVCRSLLIGNRNFDLSLFDCEEFCRQWQEGEMEFRKGFDLILWDSEGIAEVYGDNIVWLTERMSVPREQNLAGPQGQTLAELREQRQAGPQKQRQAGPSRRGKDSRELRFAIYKYSPSAEMVGAVFRVYEALTGRQPAGKRPDRVDVFAFASWQGGSGCTTLAMAAGQELVRFYRRRVLYLSLEGTESTPLYMEMPAGMKTSAEYLYHLTAGGSGGSPFLEEYLVRDPFGMEAFAPAGSCNPLHTAEKGEIRRLLSSLMDSGRFDVILVDAGSGTGEAVREALSCADRICLVSSREEAAREAEYRSFLQHGIGSETRILRIRNRCGGSQSDEEPGGSLRVAERDTAGQPILLEGTFGKNIHQLTELCYNGVATANAVS